MFKTARIQLTLRYLMIIMAVSVAFSVVIFKGASQEIDRIERIQQMRIERSIQAAELIPPEIRSQLNIPDYQNQPLEDETRQRILIFLGVINMGILIISGGLGYYLAGKTLSPIQAMVDEQNRFISDASHELRTPLTALKTMMEVSLRDKKFDLAQAKILIADNIAEVDKLHQLSERLLALMQFQKSPNKTAFTKVNFTQVVSQTIQKILPVAKEKKIHLATSLAKTTIWGDPYALISLCTIVIDNAVKYSLPNRVVDIKLHSDKKRAILTITDHGIGIAKADLPHVFDRFYRANTARTKTGAGGFGLGLAIAKEIVELHRGTIELHSILNKGTVVTISLPCFS